MSENTTQTPIEVVTTPVIVFTEKDAAYAAKYASPKGLKYYDSKLLVFGVADMGLLPDHAILHIEERGYHRKTGKAKFIASWQVIVPVTQANSADGSKNIFLVDISKTIQTPNTNDPEKIASAIASN